MNTERIQPTPRCDPEPGSLHAAAPIGLIVLLSILGYSGLLYVDHYGGQFSPVVYAPYRNLDQVLDAQPQMEGPDLRRGAALFSLACSACHQATGLGKPGEYPPLSGSDWVNEVNPARLIRIPLLGLTGPITVKGEQWNIASGMANVSSALQNDEDFAALLSYVRVSWGNKAPPVTVEQIKKVRAELGNRTDPTTAAELLAIPVK